MTARRIPSPLTGLALAERSLLSAGAAEQQRTNRWFQKVNADANGMINHFANLKKRAQPALNHVFTQVGFTSKSNLDQFRNGMRVDVARRQRHLERRAPSTLRFSKFTRLKDKE